MENDFRMPRVLGKTGLTVGRLGLGSSYGAPAAAYEKAFEQGCNYFYWGSMRREGMGDAIRHLAPQHREKLVVVLQSYSRWGIRLASHVESGLSRLGLDHADLLVLGWHNRPLGARLMDAAMRLIERGRVRHLAVSAHDRPVFLQHARDLRLEVLMVRYNAAHRGAGTEVFPHVTTGDAPRPGVVTYTATRWGTLIDPRCTPPGLRMPTAAECYRFALSNPLTDVCLTGPATAAEMDANLRALDLGPMCEDEIRWMEAVGDHVHRQTARSRRNPFMQRVQ